MEGTEGMQPTGPVTTVKRDWLLRTNDEEFVFDFKLAEVRHIVAIRRDGLLRKNRPMVSIDDEKVGRLHIPYGRTIREEDKFSDGSMRLLIVSESVLPGEDIRLEPFVDEVSLVSGRALDPARSSATYKISFMDRYRTQGIRGILAGPDTSADLFALLAWPFLIPVFVVAFLAILLVLDLLAVLLAWFVTTAGLTGRLLLHRRDLRRRDVASIGALMLLVTAPAAIAWIVRHH